MANYDGAAVYDSPATTYDTTIDVPGVSLITLGWQDISV